ncbi:hypothetical protein DFH11DRAFT_225083 [Phellopilus nigrolimitatus]|nr:hypothetical protein DFH11DRAFT_225083 [Phellopilus nigrolimitatus]
MGRRRRRSAKQVPLAITHSNLLFSARSRALDVPELLSLIFVHVFEAYSMTTPLLEMSSSTSSISIPLHLSQICQHWRVVAKSTPRIWTWINIRARRRPLDGASDMGYLQSYLDCWLERSGALPLTIYAYLYDAALFARLAQHAHRWKNVHLGVTLREAFPALGELLLAPLTALDNLELSFCGEEGPLDIPEGWAGVINLANASRMSSLHIIGRHPEEALSLRLPSSLKTLKLTRGTFLLLPIEISSLMTLEFDRATLQSISGNAVFDQVRVLTLRDTLLQPNIFSKPRLLFPHLTSLTLLPDMFDVYSHNFTYLGLVELPALQSLSVHCRSRLISNLVTPSFVEIIWVGTDDDYLPDLKWLIQRSQCQRTLQSFKVEGQIDCEDALIYVLEEMPSLDELDVVMDDVSERLLFALTVPDRQPAQTLDAMDEVVVDDVCEWDILSELPSKYYLDRVFCPKLTSIIIRAENYTQLSLEDSFIEEPEQLVRAAVNLIISKQKPPNNSATFKGNSTSGTLQKRPLWELVLPLEQHYIRRIRKNRRVSSHTQIESVWPNDRRTIFSDF